MTSRAWCFTCFDTEYAIDFDDFEDARYLVYQTELCPTTYTPHYQGYIEFKRPVRRTAVTKILKRTDCRTRWGTREEARAYCMKEDTRADGPYEFGVWEEGGQGTRTDVASLYKLVKEGKAEHEILEEMPLMWFKFHNAITKAKLLVGQSKKRNFKTEVYVILGPPRTGKSKFCMETSPEAYWKSQDQWFDLYDGQQDVILDEFTGWLKFTDLLRMLDRYPMQVQCKGGFINFAPRRIFITSNYHPWEWYKSDKIHYKMEALYERVEHWLWIDKDQEPQHYEKFSELELNHFPLIK